MPDKLTLVQTAMLMTGLDPDQAIDEGSAEWRVASAAYDAAVEEVLTRAVWNFATDVQPLARVQDAPVPEFADAFAKPGGCLLVRKVTVAGYAHSRWRIINNLICATAGGNVVSALYVREPSEETWFPLFNKVLQFKVEAALYQGLHEDVGAANGREQAAEMMLQEAKTASDQQQSGRIVFRSRVASRRGGWFRPGVCR